MGRAPAGLGEKVRDERRDVLPAVAQRRHEHGQDVEPEVEILAKPPLAHERRQVAVRRSDHANVDLASPIAAHGTHVAELEHAQELRLQVGGHVPDLVEQERPAVGLRQKTLARLDGAGEPAAHVSEDLALQQIARDRGGVHGHERLGAAGPARVDGARDELLSDARFARDDDRCARGGHEADAGPQGAHRGPVADQLLIEHGRRSGGAAFSPLLRPRSAGVSSMAPSTIARSSSRSHGFVRY